MPGISQTVTRRPLPASLSHLLNWSQTFFFFFNYKLSNVLSNTARRLLFQPLSNATGVFESNYEVSLQLSFTRFKALQQEGEVGMEREFFPAAGGIAKTSFCSFGPQILAALGPPWLIWNWGLQSSFL